MREILFRGKSIYTDEWITGYYIGTGTLVKYGDEHRSVDDETVGQFTGLTDKNGKKIFEGDILRFIAYGSDYTGKVEFLNGAFWIKCRFHDRIGAIVWQYKPEIIGNIHDNPELLEAEQCSM